MDYISHIIHRRRIEATDMVRVVIQYLKGVTN